MIFQKLKDPYPYTSDFKEALKTILFISWFVFFFVFLFRSDNFINQSSTSYKLLISSFYGLATLAVAIINTFIFRLIVIPEREEKWKVWNEILLYVVQFISIAIAIHFLSFQVMEKEMTLKGILSSVFISTIVGLIPVSLTIVYRQKKLLKKHLELANKMDKDHSKQDYRNSDEVITFDSKNYPVSEMLFFESNRNYLYIFLTDARELNMRITIKEMEKLLAKHPQFIRCHRAYIVNSSKILNIEGNAQGLKLYIDESGTYVPVSRSYIPKVDHIIRPNE